MMWGWILNRRIINSKTYLSSSGFHELRSARLPNVDRFQSSTHPAGCSKCDKLQHSPPRSVLIPLAEVAGGVQMLLNVHRAERAVHGKTGALDRADYRHFLSGFDMPMPKAFRILRLSVKKLPLTSSFHIFEFKKSRFCEFVDS